MARVTSRTATKTSRSGKTSVIEKMVQIAVASRVPLIVTTLLHVVDSVNARMPGSPF
jgi:molybdopterin-guanine dinucleotide biosynthesis protein